MTESGSVAAGGWRWEKGVSTKGPQGTLLGGGSILKLDCGGAYTTVHICQNSSNCQPKECEFS